jgi:Beta-lactamase
MDARLEARLRTDPTGDPVHVAGRFRDRVAMAATVRARPRAAVVSLRPIGAVLAVAVVLLGVLLLRPVLLAPAATPSPGPSSTPSPQPSPRAAFTSDALGALVDAWLGRFDAAARPPISVTLIGPTNVSASYSAGALPGDPATESSARIGEVSRAYVAAAIAMIDDCSQVNSEFSCRKGIFPTTMRLDDLASEWYAGWPGGDGTTVRQLVDGTSGIAPISVDLADLSRQIAASPGLDWGRQAVVARALASPRRFAAGDRREPVDTEWLVLDAIIQRATGRTSSLVIPTEAFALPFNTRLFDQAPVELMPGSRGSGSPGAPIADLDPALLDLVGNAGGIASPSADLAEFAWSEWATTETLSPAIVDLLTDAANGHAAPLGAVGGCPCDGATRLVVAQTGRAVGWSAIVAYDFETHTAVGVTLGREAAHADLDALLQLLVAFPAP